jgi:hypothetical protein
MSTTAADALVIVFAALEPDEQRETLDRMGEVQARQEAGEMSDTERVLRSLRLVAAHVGHEPSVDEYKQARDELVTAGEDIDGLTRVIRHFGSWRRAKEALQLSNTTTARRIEARFRYRRMGKVWRYNEEALRETLARCVEHYGRPPLVAEFDCWRDREFELARAEGNDTLHLPSANPYRRRWGTWEAALLHFGYTPDQVAERLEQL